MNIIIPARMKRKQSVTSSKAQDLSPVLRRRLSYMQQLQQSRIQQKVDEKQQQKYTVQKQIQLNLSIIKGHNDKIVQIIAQLQNLIENQVIMHQQCILSVVKKQINKMFMDCHQVMQRLSIILENKSRQNEASELRNQMEFFRYEAELYFATNKKLKLQNKILNQKIKQKDNMMQELNQAIKNITRKYLKEKQKRKNNLNQQSKVKDQTSTNFQKIQRKNLIKNFTQEAIEQQVDTLKQKRPKTMGCRRMKAKRLNTQKIQQPEQFQRNEIDKIEYKFSPVTELGKKYQTQIRSKSNSININSRTNTKINRKMNHSTRAHTLSMTNKNIDQQSWIYNRQI